MVDVHSGIKYTYACDHSDIFVFKQKTAYDMRISDWSSDVCSSDLRDLLDVGQGFALKFLGARQRPLAIAGDRVDLAVVCEVTEWMAQAPLRRGVGREALLKHALRRLKMRVVEVRREARPIYRHHQDLVDPNTARKVRDEPLGVDTRDDHIMVPARALKQATAKRNT